MKKLLFLILLAPLSIVAQKTAAKTVAKAVADITPSFNVSLGDTLAIDNYIIKTDTSIILIELIIRPDLGKPYFVETEKSDTFQTRRKLGVLEFYESEYTFTEWAEFKKQFAKINAEDIRKNEEEKKKQDRDIQRKRDKANIIKKDKNG
jgi:hypothetical protein